MHGNGWCSRPSPKGGSKSKTPAMAWSPRQGSLFGLGQASVTTRRPAPVTYDTEGPGSNGTSCLGTYEPVRMRARNSGDVSSSWRALRISAKSQSSSRASKAAARSRSTVSERFRAMRPA